MSHKVMLDDDVYEALQSEAVPLEDDVNSVLRRKLGLPGAKQRVAGQRRSRARGALPDQEYEQPLLRVLVEVGGAGPTKVVIDRVGELLKDRLSADDWAPLSSSKEPRWRNRVQFARLSLIKAGCMVRDSPRGYWEITDAGRDRVGSA